MENVSRVPVRRSHVPKNFNGPLWFFLTRKLIVVEPKCLQFAQTTERLRDASCISSAETCVNLVLALLEMYQPIRLRVGE